MNRIAVSAIFVLGICLLSASANAQEKVDNQIAVLAGEWKITYTNDTGRVYVIDKDGKVLFDEEKAGWKGQIKRQEAALLLEFEGDNRLERLTLGTDGRLFLEHYYTSEFLDGKKPRHIGIGVRQK